MNTSELYDEDSFPTESTASSTEPKTPTTPTTTSSSSTTTTKTIVATISEKQDNSSGTTHKEMPESPQPPVELTTQCDCVEHPGRLIADETFDVDVDTLFELIFTNSKFMRNHMTSHGRLGIVVSDWTGSSRGNKSACGAERVGEKEAGDDISSSNSDVSQEEREDSINIESSPTLVTNNIESTKGEDAKLQHEVEDLQQGQLEQQLQQQKQQEQQEAGDCNINADDVSASESIQSAAFPQSSKWIEDGSNLERKPHPVQTQQARQLNYYMNLDHFLAKQVQIEEKQSICSASPGVYVLKSVTINSGIPYGETFTVDLVYCLTRAGSLNRSRLQLHGFVNFKQEKLTWSMAMVRPMIEKSSLNGVSEFIHNLSESVKEYVRVKSKVTASPSKSAEEDPDSSTSDILQTTSGSSSPVRTTPMPISFSDSNLKNSNLAGEGASQIKKRNDLELAKSERSLNARSKSTLKAQRIKSMYKYYIGNRDDIESGSAVNTPPSDSTSLATTLGDPSSCRQSAPSSSMPTYRRCERRLLTPTNLNTDDELVEYICEHCGNACCSCSCGESLVSIGELAADSGSMVMMASEVEVDSLSIGFDVLANSFASASGATNDSYDCDDTYEPDGTSSPTSGSRSENDKGLYQGHRDKHGEGPIASTGARGNCNAHANVDKTSGSSTSNSHPCSRFEVYRRAIRMPSPMRRYLPGFRHNSTAGGGQCSPQRENYSTWLTNDGRRVRNIATQTSRGTTAWLDGPASYGFCICWSLFITIVFGILFMYVHQQYPRSSKLE